MIERDQTLRAPKDKSLFYYGSLYHRLMDPLIKPAREAIVDRIPANSAVLDVGCGTGLLCFELHHEKDCRVVGIDLSHKMLEFARVNNPYERVEFLHQDATRMNDLKDARFDYVILLNMIHELMPEQRLRVLEEALRVGSHVILFDSSAPLPWNLVGVFKRFIEISFGLDHYPQFRSYLSSGGIEGILEAAGRSESITDRATFSMGCNQLFHVSK
jgi:SAM-dependent methyltransferase